MQYKKSTKDSVVPNNNHVKFTNNKYFLILSCKINNIQKMFVLTKFHVSRAERKEEIKKIVSYKYRIVK